MNILIKTWSSYDSISQTDTALALEEKIDEVAEETTGNQ